MWYEIFDEGNEDCATYVQQTIDGGFMIAGYTFITSGIVGYQAYLIKTDSEGNVE